MVFLFLLHFPIFPVKTGFFRFDLGKFDLGIPDIPQIPEIFDLGIFPIFIFPFDLGKFDLGIPDIPHIPEIFDLGIFAHFFLVGFSAHFVPIPPFPILLKDCTKNAQLADKRRFEGNC